MKNESIIELNYIFFYKQNKCNKKSKSTRKLGHMCNNFFFFCFVSCIYLIISINLLGCFFFLLISINTLGICLQKKKTTYKNKNNVIKTKDVIIYQNKVVFNTHVLPVIVDSFLIDIKN